MKKLIAIISLVVFCLGVSRAEIRSVDQFNSEVPNDVIQIADDGNLDMAKIIKIDNNLALQFEVAVDTTSVDPTAAGQLILGDNYNLFLSTASGGNWYQVGGK